MTRGESYALARHLVSGGDRSVADLRLQEHPVPVVNPLFGEARPCSYSSCALLLGGPLILGGERPEEGR